MSDITPIPPASEREREAFEDAYQADSRDPSMAEDLRHFLTGYRAALSHPSTPQGALSVEALKALEKYLMAQPLSYGLLERLHDVRCALKGWPPAPEQGGKG